MKKRILLFVLAVFYLSCQKQVVTIPDEFDLAMEKVTLDCTGKADSIFFQSKINGKDFCMSTDKDSGFIGGVIEPVFNNFNIQFFTDHNQGSFKPFFKIEAPRGFAKINDVVLCDKYLQKGASFPLSSFDDILETRFKITVQVKRLQPHPDFPSALFGSVFQSQTQSGDQSANANIVFDDVIKTETATTVTYNVKGHFNCKLYRASSSDTKGKLIWDIQNAQFKFLILAAK